MCIEQQLKYWKEKLEATGEPLSKEETLRLVKIAETLSEDIKEGSLEEMMVEVEIQPDCLNTHEDA
jgi:hypothetical protein